MSNVATIRSGGHLAPIVPQSIEDVYRLATMAMKSGMLKPVQSGYGDSAVIEPPEATLARGTMIIMQGMEIGVPPMQSIQLLAMINGRITAHSEAVPGILWAKGFKLKEWFTGTEMADDWTAHCEITRPTGEKIEGTFSVKDAKQARLWDQRAKVTKKGRGGSPYEADNDASWFKYPKRMLKARALGFAGKDGGADALRGIQIREEAEDMDRVAAMRDITPTTAALDLPDIPEPPSIDDAEPADETAEAKQHIKQALNVEMLQHLRSFYAEADWEALAPAYDAKLAELQAVQS
jgi:hypothetical protein